MPRSPWWRRKRTQEEMDFAMNAYLNPPMPADGTVMTTAEYFRTAETNRVSELVYGVVRVAEAPAVVHQRVVRDVSTAMQAHVDKLGLGEVLFAPVDVVLDAARALVVQPDILFIASDRADLVGNKIYGAPDLVVEVLNPLPRVGKLEERVGWFAAHGVREVWLVQLTRRTVEIMICEDGRVATQHFVQRGAPLGSKVLPTLPNIFTWSIKW